MKTISLLTCLRLAFLTNAAAVSPLCKRDIICPVISNGSSVNCRTLPSFDCEVLVQMEDGLGGYYYCWASGDCYRVNWYVKLDHPWTGIKVK